MLSRLNFRVGLVQFASLAIVVLLLGGTYAAGQKSKSSTAPSKPASSTSKSSQPGGSSRTGTSVSGRPGTSHADPNPTAVGTHALPGGGSREVKPGGVSVDHDVAGRRTAFRAPGMQARFGKDGRPSMVRTERNGEVRTVRHLPGGGRMVETVSNRPGIGHQRVVSYGPNRGFVERPWGGHPGYMRRTYLMHGRRYAVVYRGYRYRGYEYYRPVPAVIYAPQFYAWGYQPWPAPVYYSWGWQAEPWYGYYGPAFAPYPVYASPDQWMTDALLAADMQAAYDAGQANAAAGPPPVITPELKAQIDAEVQAELREQQQAAAAGPDSVAPPASTVAPEAMPDVLKPGHEVFRVVSAMDVEVDGQPCSLATNDFLTRVGGLDDATGTVAVTVSASRATDCTQGATTKVSLTDLQAMEADQQEQLALVLKEATQKMGKNGLPAAPPSGAVQVAAGNASADTSTDQLLTQADTEATQTEQDVLKAANSSGS